MSISIQDISAKNILELKSIVQEYPYFQFARALYLKKLKEQESFKYNNELKITAAYTVDRAVLFDYITSFETLTISEKQDISRKTDKSRQSQTSELIIGSPLEFAKSETHSFQQWLTLASQKKVIRVDIQGEKTSKKQEKASIIDKFIALNPKIPKATKITKPLHKPNELRQSKELMTETLAKVYLEQHKYDSAIKAYKILSLKYPEKISYFANQIKRIQILQNSK